MRIGIDARELCGRATGVGRYLGGLLREWAARSARAHATSSCSTRTSRSSLSLDARRFATRTIAGARRHAGGSRCSCRARRRPIISTSSSRPAYTAPLRLGGADRGRHPRSVVRRAPGVVRAARRRAAALADRASRRSRARAVITISEFSKRELIERLDVPADEDPRDTAWASGPTGAALRAPPLVPSPQSLVPAESCSSAPSSTAATSPI